MARTLQHRGSISKVRRRAAGAALALAVTLVPALVATPSAQAQHFSLLYTFKGRTDGAYPHADLLLDAGGSLYGTTERGGTFNSGTVFKVDATGAETVLYSFSGGADGGTPEAGLIVDDAGNLYGTTEFGGDLACFPSAGCGTVFKLDTTGTETVLHSFRGGDGVFPRAGLVRDAAGSLYGTTWQGGAFPTRGTVFRLNASGKETMLHSFTRRPDGANPIGGLVRDAAGNLYGSTLGGGDIGRGTVFKLDATGTETVLHSFNPFIGDDGKYPYAAIIRDEAGNLYGTTSDGGPRGCGIVFKLDTTGTETVLYGFHCRTDGGTPFARLVRDEVGNLYGTTYYGGDLTCIFAVGCGTVFKLDATGKETVLYSFRDRTDGRYPLSGLVRDEQGNLYGTTSEGGNFGSGTVFKITP